MTKRNILIYTDSRGQHIPRGQSHDVFGTRLAARDDLQVDLFLCPMKWTTTLDFLLQLEETQATAYDHIILQTGIVDWSPRPQQSAISDLYNNQSPRNLSNSRLNTRDYSAKVVNNKKAIFDRVFGADSMERHLANAFDVQFEGQPTINMYGPAMAREHLVPRLAALDNLLYINSNHFVPDWKGDHSRGRPTNIDQVTSQLSSIFRDGIGSERVIDLLAWDQDEIKKYTCDNIHLTTAGSDYIYDEICRRLKLDEPRQVRLGGLLKGDLAKKGDTSQKPDMISVVVPVYNVEKYLLECLQSLAAQDDPNFEVVIVIDGATDASAEIAEKFIADRPNFRIHHQENKGLGGARNTGIDLALGKLITFVDSDDTVEPGHLSGMRKVQEAGNYNVVSARFQSVDETGQFLAFQQDPPTPDHLKSLPLGRKILGVCSSSISCSRLYKLGFLRNTGVRFPEKFPHEDLFFTYKILLQSGEHAYSEGNTYHWRQRDGSLSRSASMRHADAIFALFDDTARFLDNFDADEQMKALAAKRNVTLISNLNFRMQRPETGSITYRYFLQGIKQRRNQLTDFFKVVDNILGKECVPGNARKLVTDIDKYIDNVRKQKTGSVVSDDLIFPHETLSLANTDAAEIGKVKSADTERIRQLYNAYKGKRCFIIGNGPSLNKQDLSLLENEYTFAVNSFYYKTRETGFRPSFFVVEDTMVMKENADEIRNYDVPFKFFPTLYRDIQPEADNTFFFEMNQGFYTKSSPNYCVPRFSTDASKVLYCGQTVTYINLQLAFFMGFTEVYLIGMDFNYIIPAEHKRSGNHILSTTDDPNHFHKDYFGKGKTWKDPKLDRVALNYMQAKLTFESVGRKIYNATVGGHLEIFERVNPYHILGVPHHPMAKEADALLNNKEKLMSPNASAAASVPAPAETDAAQAIAEPQAEVQMSVAANRARASREKTGFAKYLSQRPLKVVAPVILVSAIILAVGASMLEGAGNWRYVLWTAAGVLGLAAFRVATRAWARVEARRMLQNEAVIVQRRIRAAVDVVDRRGEDRALALESAINQTRTASEGAIKQARTASEGAINQARKASENAISAARADFDGQLKALKKVLDEGTARASEMEAMRDSITAHVSALKDLIHAVELKGEGQKRSILDDVGQRIANAESKWAQELENAQESSSGVLAQSLGGMEQGLDEIKRMVSVQIESLQASVDQMRKNEAEIERKTAAAIAAIQQTVQTHGDERIQEVSTNIQEVSTKLASIEGEVGNVSGELGSLSESLTAQMAETRNQTEAARATLTQLNDKIAGINTQMPSHNLRGAQAFNRKLTQDHVATIRKDWSKRLSLSPTPESLFYMAHRISKLEENGRGRMATTVEDAIVRVLAASSTHGDTLKVLEIGTLYGLGLAAIYDYSKSRFKNVKITALDPLDGYYGKARADITGEPVSEQTFWRNMDLAGVDRKDVTLIKRLSTDDEAIELASREQYDLLIIDGDHSYSGVKADYVHYAPFVKRGGIILFDDYNVAGWPDVTQFVDEEAVNAPEIALVGKSWRSAMFKVIRSFENAEKPGKTKKSSTSRKTAK